MPSFLKELRRKSRSSFKTERSPTNGSPDGSSSSNGAIGRHPPNNQSSSTLTSNLGSTTPPSTLPSENSETNLKSSNGSASPVRPMVSTKRYSINSTANSPTTVSGLQRPFSGTSAFAPCVTSVSENSWVNQKVLLIRGRIGDPTLKPLDGTVTIFHHHDSFPPTYWPVCDSHFKALVHLQPGPNRIRLEFNSTKLSSGSSGHSSMIQLNYLPLTSTPPLQLAIILAKDSPETYDAVPDRIQREGNGLHTAVRKFRMAAYLWQAFTGEQMNRHGFGRRCFRYEEEWTQGTLTYHDSQSGQMRNEAKIHIIRSDKTVEEIRNLDLAQQYEKAQRKGDLYGIAMESVKNYFRPRPGQKLYVSCMFLDTHWDSQVGTVRGHAALGGGDGTVQLAIFGSHALQSYPASIEEVVPAFTDCTRTDTKHVANDCNESGSNWEAANIGIGAHMHETGHLFGCPHQESGVMLRDYVRLNRTFTINEPYSTRTKSQGQRVLRQEDECTWHRLDCLRFRYHPCFRQPADVPMSADDSIQVWSVGNNQVLVTATSGIAFIELYPEGDDVCHYWLEYPEPSANGGPIKQITLTEADLRSRLPEEKRNRKLKLELHSCGQGKHIVEDFSALLSKSNRVKLPDGRAGFKGSKLGFSQMDGSKPQELILESAFIQTKLLTSIKVYHGFALDGIEFIYEDSTSQLFGQRGGKPGGSEFPLDTRKGETVMGFHLRAGLWIDGLQILTTLGRRSEIFGNPTGGSAHTLIPPRGYAIAGISGSLAAWVDGFSLIITR
ncbi:hypothetical protein H2199_002130 [Coniosporium tulheliwenetii]|uniref:Uncharacterized protein n=1 Tax=Coniosporium tulheliwenetii TaxID=3383036 RepID=A0ACC2ZHY1_9PEZI|nr:hypothetical protein H2199_002130 [Cladosporium sp. JES 115]